MLLIISLMRPWGEVLLLLGRKERWGLIGEVDLQEGVNSCPRNHSHHVCISSDSSPNITQTPTTWISSQKPETLKFSETPEITQTLLISLLPTLHQEMESNVKKK